MGKYTPLRIRTAKVFICLIAKHRMYGSVMSLWHRGVNRIVKLDKHCGIIFYEYWLKFHVKFIYDLECVLLNYPFFNVYAFFKI